MAELLIVDVSQPDGSIVVPRILTDVTLLGRKFQLAWSYLILLLSEERLPVIISAGVTVVYIASLKGRFCTFGLTAMNAHKHTQVELRL